MSNPKNVALSQQQQQALENGIILANCCSATAEAQVSPTPKNPPLSTGKRRCRRPLMTDASGVALTATPRCTHTFENVEFWRLRRPGEQQMPAAGGESQMRFSCCHDSQQHLLSFTLSLALSLALSTLIFGMLLSVCVSINWFVSLPRFWLKDSAAAARAKFFFVTGAYPDLVFLYHSLSFSILRASGLVCIFVLSWQLNFAGMLPPEGALVTRRCSPVTQDAFCV